MNWGHGITLVFLSFVILMVTMVYQSFQQTFDLVADNYYEQEIHYQQTIDQKINAQALDKQPVLKVKKGQILVEFPQDSSQLKPTGELYFFRASNATLDIKTALELDNTGQQTISTEKFETGLYTLKLSWQMDGKDYYKEDQVYIQ
ncbi:MAG: nitrogen fixation protein FixH [Aureispira sp.]|nr:nitrogen fixation protein FixH [Aureispira sp.]